jgi:uncharacterized protein YyaL (SSP411 family)
VANRLAQEHSPYLLQHQHNPVDWYPWGDEAFARARREGKPIFLSIGYSTCHWCHVMEHESFEDAGIAAVLNELFVSIKVDREERPDVDRVYMTFVQATTGSGGWPMSVWLTPELAPFYGGTYFPPRSKWGKPGFVELLQEIARAWREERDKVLQSAGAIVERLRSFGAREPDEGLPPPSVLDRATSEFAGVFDRRRGGFGSAPKFPRPSELLFLLREHARTGAAEPREMAVATLGAMAMGGMRDHLGGGFHRYSVDGDWRVPHFEKMLYDQAQLVLAYVEAAQVTGDRYYAEVALDTLEYVRRDMTDAGGGFYSAEDADSIPPEQAGAETPHKSEGAFYIWRDDEIVELLGEDAPIFRARYGVLPGGNAPFDPQEEFTGKNLLYTARPLETIASEAGTPLADVVASLRRSRAVLFAARNQRPRPHLDDKVLTAWNGLMIAAFSRAGRLVPGAARYIADAQRAARFVRERLWDAASRTLTRRYRQGHSAVEGYAEDYAFLIFGLLELFQADGDAAWLDWAIALQTRQDELFGDADGGGWFSTSGQDPSVLLRLKEDYDGAEPSASSIGAHNLNVLAHLTGDAAAIDRLDHTLRHVGSRAAASGRAAPMMLAVLSSYHAGVRQVVVLGEHGLGEQRAEREAGTTGALMEVIRGEYLPSTIVVPVDYRNQEAIARLLPWVGAMTATENKEAAAYVCRDFTCQAPTGDPQVLATALRSRGR